MRGQTKGILGQTEWYEMIDLEVWEGKLIGKGGRIIGMEG